MKAFASLRARLGEEAGFTLVELVTVCAVMGTVLGAVVQLMVSGNRATVDATARMTAQQNIRATFDRLEYDARCASNASLLSSGAGVYLTLPSQCDHATGTVTWCVSSGSLVRNTGTTCSATSHAITYIQSVTSATPFSCYSPVSGSTPQLEVNLSVNTTTRNADKKTATDFITLHNASSTGCA